MRFTSVLKNCCVASMLAACSNVDLFFDVSSIKLIIGYTIHGIPSQAAMRLGHFHVHANKSIGIKIAANETSRIHHKHRQAGFLIAQARSSCPSERTRRAFEGLGVLALMQCSNHVHLPVQTVHKRVACVCRSALECELHTDLKITALQA